MGTIGRTNTGGAGLNLTVLASVTQPSNPVENLIWFNTDTAIPHWYFQNDAPSDPELGDVYVTISTTATNVLQVLRNNGMKLYFGTARQWDGDSWELVGGKIYYNGTWHNLQTFVYDGTIGNAENNFNHSVGGYPWLTSTGNSSTSISTANDSFTCYYIGGGTGLCYTKNKIDFSAVKSVKITYTASSGGYVVWKRAQIFTSASGGNAVGVVAETSVDNATAKTTITLNTSSLSGQYYFGFGYYSNSSGTVNVSFKIYSIELIS